MMNEFSIISGAVCIHFTLKTGIYQMHSNTEFLSAQLSISICIGKIPEVFGTSTESDIKKTNILNRWEENNKNKQCYHINARVVIASLAYAKKLEASVPIIFYIIYK